MYLNKYHGNMCFYYVLLAHNVHPIKILSQEDARQTYSCYIVFVRNRKKVRIVYDNE